jgi:hypothetical protein
MPVCSSQNHLQTCSLQLLRLRRTRTATPA